MYDYKENTSNLPINSAIAHIKGGPLASQITGTVIFRDVSEGVEVTVNVNGLPQYRPAYNNNQPIGPHGFHIHEYGNCSVGDINNPFYVSRWTLES